MKTIIILLMANVVDSAVYHIDILSNEGPLAPALRVLMAGNRLTGILGDCLTLAQSHIASLAGSPLIST